jgi:hypothetical protein
MFLLFYFQNQKQISTLYFYLFLFILCFSTIQTLFIKIKINKFSYFIRQNHFILHRQSKNSISITIKLQIKESNISVMHYEITRFDNLFIHFIIFTFIISYRQSENSFSGTIILVMKGQNISEIY